MSHYDETRNRFNPDNRFIGDIEDGKKYPFGCYTKEESDARYELKSEAFDPTEIEAEVAALSATVTTKASNNDLQALAAVVNTKANASDLTAIYNRLAALETAVSQKANESECVEIRARLDALESDAIRINSFTASSTSYEKGASATVTLTWSLNKTATSETINNVAVTGTSKAPIESKNSIGRVPMSFKQSSISFSVSCKCIFIPMPLLFVKSTTSFKKLWSYK